MDPITIAAIMGGTGLLKSQLVDAPREERQRKQRAAEIRYSPWTKMAPSTQIQESDAFGSTMQGAMTGASLGQGLENQALSKKLTESQIGAMDRYSGNGAAPSVAGPTVGGMNGTPFWWMR